MRIALLISGSGTTAEHILLACASGRLKGVVPVCLIASRADAPGIGRAKATGMEQKDILVIRPEDFPSREAFGEAIIHACRARGAEFLGQYGWMCKTPENVIEAFKGMMVNQHPGPLDPGRPDFGGAGMYGRRVHCARLLFVRAVNRDFWSEATAQRVASEFDMGSVLKRRQVPILPDDDVPALQARMLPIEHEVQVETIADFAAGRVRELVREKPLVRPTEEKILKEAKRKAVELYPDG